MSCVAADSAFEFEGLFFCCFGEFSLEGVFLSAVAFFLSFVVSFSFGECSAFSCLVQGYRVKLVSFAFGAVRADFFGNVHVGHY